jgi:hypothetical protein
MEGVQGEIDFFRTKQKLKLKFYEDKIRRGKLLLTRAEKRATAFAEAKARQPVGEFLGRLSQEEVLDSQFLKEAASEGTDTEDEEADLGPDFDDAGQGGVELDAEFERELALSGQLELKLANVDYFTRKQWEVLPHLPKAEKAPRHPKKHYFDLPQFFDAEGFRQDLPLYSPKADAMLRLIREDDKRDQAQFGKKFKLLIFCEDVYALRAAAGALVSDGWTFGMSKRYVRWKKTYHDSATGKLLKTLTSKTQQLTWLPDAQVGGAKARSKRFLILTRSKLGGTAGATLNEFSVQKIGAMDAASATYNHPDNMFGEDFRAVLIDRNFIEGVDLPAKYGYLFDDVLSQANRTQIVGRISRFCGSEGTPFVPNYGWPQTVYRLSLKFHTVGLHFSEAQLQKLETQVTNPSPNNPYRKLIPEQYLEGFVPKLERDLFSPLELRLLLDGNMEVQRLKKRTLDAYEALLEQSSIGALLYAPAMANLEASRRQLNELLLEEEETMMEYKQDIFSQDAERQEQIKYNLRSLRKDLINKYQVENGRMFNMVQGYVSQALRKTVPKKDLVKWREPDRRQRLFDRTIRVALRDARFIDLDPAAAEQLMNDMLDEAVKESEVANGQKQSKLQMKQQRQHASTQKYMGRQQVMRLKALKTSLNQAKKELKFSNERLRKKPELWRELWNHFKAMEPDAEETEFDTLLAENLVKRPRAPRTSSRKSSRPQ